MKSKYDLLLDSLIKDIMFKFLSSCSVKNLIMQCAKKSHAHTNWLMLCNIVMIDVKWLWLSQHEGLLFYLLNILTERIVNAKVV